MFEATNDAVAGTHESDAHDIHSALASEGIQPQVVSPCNGHGGDRSPPKGSSEPDSSRVRRTGRPERWAIRFLRLPRLRIDRALVAPTRNRDLVGGWRQPESGDDVNAPPPKSPGQAENVKLIRKREIDCYRTNSPAAVSVAERRTRLPASFPHRVPGDRHRRARRKKVSTAIGRRYRRKWFGRAGELEFIHGSLSWGTGRYSPPQSPRHGRGPAGAARRTVYPQA
jgi:hypothetical protein